MFMCDGTNLLDRFNGSDLIVSKHHRDQNGIRADCLLDIFRGNQPVCIHIQICHFIALLFQISASMQDGMMFDLGRDDVFSLILVDLCNTL